MPPHRRNSRPSRACGIAWSTIRLRNSGGIAPHSAAHTIDDSTSSPCRRYGRRSEKMRRIVARSISARSGRSRGSICVFLLEIWADTALLDAELGLQRHPRTAEVVDGAAEGDELVQLLQREALRLHAAPGDVDQHPQL